MRTLAAAVLFAFCAPLVGAEHVRPGSETLPELEDATGDVSYDPVYVGPRDHHYLDVVSGWFDHDPVFDRVTFHLKVDDASALARRTGDNGYACSMSAYATLGGEILANVTTSWSKQTGTDSIQSYALYSKRTSGGVGVSFGNAVTMKHEFEPKFVKPGYYEWRINRSELLQLGDRLDSLRARCYEFGSPSIRFIPLYYNQDTAQSKSEYSLKELRRVAGPEGAKDPVEAYSPTPEASPTMTEAGSSALGILVVLAACAVAALIRRVPRP